MHDDPEAPRRDAADPDQTPPAPPTRPWSAPGAQPPPGTPPRPPWAAPTQGPSWAPPQQGPSWAPGPVPQPPPAPPAWGAPAGQWGAPQWGTPAPPVPPVPGPAGPGGGGGRRGLLIGAVVAAVVGLLLVVAPVAVVLVTRDGGRSEQAGPAERSEAAAAAGCTFTRQFPSAGAEHVGADEPATDWNSNPPTSGQHTARSAPPGFYERELDERAVVHSLEHGYVAVQYRNLAPDQVARLRDLAADHAGEKLIVMPWSGLTADGVAITAWQHGQTCEQVAPDVIEAFMTDFMAPGGRRSVAPEPFAQ